METLRAFAIRATYGLALAIGGVATLLPSAALAASDVFGLVSAEGFGSIDLPSAVFTQIGGPTGLTSGYYAPVFDPAANAFFVTNQPIGGGFSNQIDRIDATTGAVTPLLAMPTTTGVEGLGVDPTTGRLFALTTDGFFGSVDLTSGAFTQIGGPTGLAAGNYAPVFDPAANAFFVTNQPIGDGFSNQIDRIDATTGAVTPLLAMPTTTGVEGLGVDPTTGRLFALTTDGFFGSVDLTSGAFTQIGGPTGLAAGNYAPVFDPQTNSFVVTESPLSGDIFTNGTNGIGVIEESTGSVDHSTITSVDFVEGLGVASSPLAAVPEPPTWTMMVVGFAALGYAAFRRSGKSRSEGFATQAAANGSASASCGVGSGSSV